MKKVYLVLSAFFVAGSVSAQVMKTKAPEKIALPTVMPRGGYVAADRAAGDNIYTDDFSTPALWDVTADANGNAWQIVTTTPTNVSDYMGDMASTTAANGFACYDGISDLLAHTVTASDCYVSLIAPVNCSTHPYVTMEFEQRYRAFNSDQTIVEVSNDGSTWTQWEINTDLVTNSAAVQETYRINISAVAGSQATVYVRFHWLESGGDPDYGSGYGWMVDDLKIFESWDYDQAITASWARSGVGVSYAGGLDYGNYTTAQVAAVEFSGMTENLGAQIQAGAKLNVTVSGPETYSGTSATTDLPIGASDSLFATTDFSPTTLGSYDITYWFDGTNAEQVTDNDTLYGWFDITDHTFGRDNGVITSSIGSVSSSLEGVLSIGNTMDVFATGVIGAIDVRLTSDATNVGQLIYGECWKYDDGVGDWVFLDATADHTVTDAENGDFVKLFFSSAVAVNAGDLILITAGHYGGATRPRFGMAQPVEEQTVLGYSDGSGFYLSSPSAIMVRADMRDFESIDEEVANNFTIGQNVPNPFNNNTVIEYTLTESANVSVKVVDMAGREVMTMNPGNQAAGDHKISIDGSTFNAGTYFYTFTVGNKQVTKRMVVTK